MFVMFSDGARDYKGTRTVGFFKERLKVYSQQKSDVSTYQEFDWKIDT